MVRTVLYIADVVPLDVGASSAVVHRHLRALERSGYRIVAIVPERTAHNRIFPVNWDVVRLPDRRWYYPPYRQFKPLQSLRWKLFDRLVAPFISDRSQTCVVSVMSGRYLSLYARHVSIQANIPLFYFLHDRSESINYNASQRTRRAIREYFEKLSSTKTLKRIWTVSPQLTYDGNRPSSLYKIVFPLPERIGSETAMTFIRPRTSPLILAHMGVVYNEALNTFRMICRMLSSFNGKLILYTHHAVTANQLASEFPNVVICRGFNPDTKMMLKEIGQEASGLIVAYPNDPDTMPWCVDCFPSKFVQACQTKLPIAVFAHPRTSTGIWCASQKWLLYYASADEKSISDCLTQFGREDVYKHASLQSTMAAETIFNPSFIEEQITSDIESAMIDNSKS